MYRLGVKHQVPDALSRIETTGGESGPLDYSIPCPETVPSTGYNFDDAQILVLAEEDYNFDSCPTGECLSLIDNKLGAEPISTEEWLSEQSYDSLCQTLWTNAEMIQSYYR